MRVRTLTALAAGTVVAIAARRPSLVPWPAPVRIALPTVLAGASATAVTVAPVAPRLLRPRRLALLAGAGAGLWWGGRVARQRLLDRLTRSSRELDAAFATPPATPRVSGSSASSIPLTTLGREGARFVHTRAHDEAIRIFVGADSAATPEERVELALQEVERTGAFERGTLIVQAPAGTGYANPTPMDVVELRTGGDCASIVVGYGLLPSFLSLGSVDIAARTQRYLLERLVALGAHPRVLLYGESLGALVQQMALPAGSADLDRFGVHAALWVGTPGGVRGDEFRSRCTSYICVDSPRDIPNPVPRERVWFLEHHGDPVVRFRRELITQRPEWLAGPRGRNVPEGMRWSPGITWAQVLVDTLFATDVTPGEFESLGHDYRADLGAVVTAAYGLSEDSPSPEELEATLRERERSRARLIGEI